MTQQLRRPGDTRAVELPSFVRDIIRSVVREARPLRVILFGSYARGTASAASDVDLLVVADSDAERGSRCRQLDALLRDRAPRADLLWRTPDEVAAGLHDPASFIACVWRSGVVVYEARLPYRQARGLRSGPDLDISPSFRLSPRMQRP